MYKIFKITRVSLFRDTLYIRYSNFTVIIIEVIKKTVITKSSDT